LTDFAGLSVRQREGGQSIPAGASSVHFSPRQRLRQSLAMVITILFGGGLQAPLVRVLARWKHLR